MISKFRLKKRMNVTECSPFAWKKSRPKYRKSCIHVL